MHIYGVMLSPYVARVALAARFKGVKYTVAPPEGGLKSPAFLKLNPLGKVPTITDGKTVLFESGVILEYLEDKYKKKRMVPAAAKAAAQARLTAAVFGEYVQGAIGKLFAHMGPGASPPAVAAILADVARYLDVADDMIAAKPFAASAKFSIADCYAAPCLFFATLFLPRFGMENPLAGRKKLERYLAKAQKDKVIGSILREMKASFEDWAQKQAA